MDTVIAVVANLLRVRGDDFYLCSSPFQSFQPFNRCASFKTLIKITSWESPEKSGCAIAAVTCVGFSKRRNAWVCDLVLPGLTADGTISPELQKKVLEFVLRVQGIKEPVAPEKVYDFTPVKKISAELAAEK
jgi:hypothetical protein